MDHREVEQEIEGLDIESRKVAELLGGLKRVEAPSNFDFGVRARIANGAPAQGSRLVPILKLAAPLALILIVATIIVLYSGRQVAHQPQIAGSIPETSAAPSNASPVSKDTSLPVAPDPKTLAGIPAESAPANIPPVAANPPVNRRLPRGRSVDHPMNGGSLPNQALTEPVTINPPGIVPSNGRNANSAGGPDIPVSEVLQMLGVSADPEDGGWKVKSIAEGSTSRKSGVKTGDVIESIDGRQLTPTTSFKGTFDGKTLRVRRDGKSIDLKITN